MSDTHWPAYYQTVGVKPPRELLRHALTFFPEVMMQPAQALDLGCGTGSTTLELLRLGWRVDAIDQEPEAIRLVLQVTPAEVMDRLHTQVSNLTDCVYPPADFIWAGLSLPFIHPSRFYDTWVRVLQALKPGGVFAGDFFGPQSAWRVHDWMTFHTATQVKVLFKGLDLLFFAQEYGLRKTALQGHQRLQSFQVIARRPVPGQHKAR